MINRESIFTFSITFVLIYIFLFILAYALFMPFLLLWLIANPLETISFYDLFYYEVTFLLLFPSLLFTCDHYFWKGP